MNHSEDFWQLVSTYDPNAKAHRKELKNFKLRPHLNKLGTSH
jgi:predicted metal-dependent hydrolase